VASHRPVGSRSARLSPLLPHEPARTRPAATPADRRPGLRSVLARRSTPTQMGVSSFDRSMRRVCQLQTCFGEDHA
jgi:hypothetical protein